MSGGGLGIVLSIGTASWHCARAGRNRGGRSCQQHVLGRQGVVISRPSCATSARPLHEPENLMPVNANLSIDDLCVATIKGLTIDAIQAANSGHPGMPMGMAHVAHVLWSQFLKVDPTQPDWPDRDRFVLSAGHGSMLQYSLLHLYGFALSMEEIKQFRQLHSRTPGHPERGHTPGIETTTGPLGQGLANGVGMALAEARLRAEFGQDLCDHWTYVIAGDGCMMEGISHEASSLAGHLGLGRLICFYDSNHISIDGRTEITFTDDTAARFRAYHWQVLEVGGTDKPAIADAIRQAHADLAHPTLIICHTTIGDGSPKMAGSEKVHGQALGVDEVAATKRNIGLDPEQFFHVEPSVYEHLRARNPERKAVRERWEQTLRTSPHGEALKARYYPDFQDLDQKVQWPAQDVGAQLSTRKGGEKVIQAIAPHVPGLMGGSADLGHSTFTDIAGGGFVATHEFAGRNVHWGVREHAMAAVCNGIATHGGHVPYGATFLVFHDYMRPSVRLAALMGVQNIFVYTHDSIFVGEDGPTHQPVETLTAMRCIPNLVTLRPADLAETGAAWLIAVRRTNSPTALALTRQNLPELQRDPAVGDPREAVMKGGYVLREAQAKLQLVILATGSEVQLAVGAKEVLEKQGVGVRVVSMPSCELFDVQTPEYKAEVLPRDVKKLSVEAGLTMGWARYVGQDGASVGLDHFGASAPDKVLAKHFGFTIEHVVETARKLLA
jgi:transketolase